MSVWQPIDDKAKDGNFYAVLFDDPRPPPKNAPYPVYRWWARSAQYHEGNWRQLDPASVFDKWLPIPEDHVATHYADMSLP